MIYIVGREKFVIRGRTSSHAHGSVVLIENRRGAESGRCRDKLHIQNSPYKCSGPVTRYYKVKKIKRS
jgi:hypothetical protein